MEKRIAYNLIYIGLNIRHLTYIGSTYKIDRTIKLLKELEQQLKLAHLQTTLSGFNIFSLL